MRLEEYFRAAIHQADWKKVCRVFTKITGEAIEPPVIRQSFANLEIEDEISEVEMDDDDEDDATETSDIPPPKSSEDFISKAHQSHIPSRHGRREHIRKPINTFVDDKKLAKKDLPSSNPQLSKLYVERNRVRDDDNRLRKTNTAQRVDIECCTCHQTFNVSLIEAANKYDEETRQSIYRCDRCCAKEGKR